MRDIQNCTDVTGFTSSVNAEILSLKEDSEQLTQVESVAISISR